MISLKAKRHPQMRKNNLEITDKDNGEVKKSKKENQVARAANKKGFRDLVMDRSQNISLHFICITLHLHYITFAFKNRATSARNA